MQPETAHLKTGDIGFGNGTNGGKSEGHIFQGIESKVDAGMIDGGYFTRQSEIGRIDKAQNFQGETGSFLMTSTSSFWEQLISEASFKT